MEYILNRARVEAFGQEVDRFKEVHDALLWDFQSVKRERLNTGNTNPSLRPQEVQRTCRIVIRQFFALFEGDTYHLKRLALTLPQKSYTFSAAEIACLSEQSFYITSVGEAKEGEARLTTLANFRFAVRTIESVYDITGTFDFGNHRWETFQKVLKIRDRLTHPKGPESIVVTQEDILMLDEASAWYIENFLNLKNAIVNSSKSATGRLQKAIRDRKK